ncbi:MAG: LacI family DNA-binding transcriptional regulator [Pseudomonadota bacterium]|nr:LacI family DNA-binding transcriptional regulator [Pseudomonadota bacterium]
MMDKKVGTRSRRRSGGGVTMAAVARHAGVSSMTVSNVLNNKPSVLPATRDAVLKAIAELDYRPNTAARALASASNYRIGLLHRDSDSALLSAMLVGTLNASARLGVQLNIKVYDQKNPLDSVREFLNTSPDGLLLPPPLCERVSAAGLPEEYDVPMVALASGRELANMHCVRIDDEQAAYETTGILLRAGHRRIGFVRIPSLAGESRFAGYARALSDQGLTLDEALVWNARPTFDAGLRLAEEILPGKRTITAMFAGNDDMAAAFVNVALRTNLRIPEDISVVGFDDTPIAVKIWPALTTVRQPLGEIAEVATRHLVAELQARDKETKAAPGGTTFVDYQIIERNSVAPPSS